MESKESWWSKSVEPLAGTQTQPAVGAPQPTEDPAFDGESIGEQIDRAIGEFDAKLASLREELDDNRVRAKDIAKEIGDVEKDQAMAMKELLNTNPRIREMLGAKAKVKVVGKRRKKTTKSDDA